MSVFDNNITKEHPLDCVFEFVKETIDMRFRSVIKDAQWNPNHAAHIFSNEFLRKSVFFEQSGVTETYVIVESYSMKFWRVTVSGKFGINIICLYDEYIERHWEDVDDIDIDITTFKENL